MDPSTNSFQGESRTKFSLRRYLTCFDDSKHHRVTRNNKKRSGGSLHPYASFCDILCMFMLICIVATVLGVTLPLLLRSPKSNTPTNQTTTIIRGCALLCSNESWTFSSNIIARWTFDNSFNDTSNQYTANYTNSPSFSAIGYINEAAFFNSTYLQSLTISSLSLANSSFTIEVWIQPTSFPNVLDHAILGLCQSLSTNKCLQILIRKSSSNYFLYFGFYSNDCYGTTSISLNEWTHAAFVFDITTMTQTIYVDGTLDAQCSTSSALLEDQDDITIGVIPALISTYGSNYYQGLIDHLTFTQRVKSSCEILEDSSLVVCYQFDSSSPYTDSGPNGILTSHVSTTIVSSGHSGEAVYFNGSGYVEGASFSALGSSNQSFSILFWVQPNSVNRTLVHITSTRNSVLPGWCIPFIGIDSNGEIVVQVEYNGLNLPHLNSTSLSMSPTWTHVAETWSTTNGLNLYINGTLVGSAPSANQYAASETHDYVLIGSARWGVLVCYGGGLGRKAPGEFIGAMDDFRIYSRELTAAEVNKTYFTL